MCVSVGKDRPVSVKNTSTHKAKKIAITAEDELSIAVGKTKLVMRKDGTISLPREDIKMEGSGLVQLM